MGQKCTLVLDLEILAISEACRILLTKEIRGKIGIFVDSQAAFLSLDSCTTSSIIVGQCKEELFNLGRLSEITLVWVPGHRDFYGNERADELARAGSALEISTAVSVSTPLGIIKSGIFEHYLLKAKNRWRKLDTCLVARQTWSQRYLEAGCCVDGSLEDR